MLSLLFLYRSQGPQVYRLLTTTKRRKHHKVIQWYSNKMNVHFFTAFLFFFFSLFFMTRRWKTNKQTWFLCFPKHMDSPYVSKICFPCTHCLRGDQIIDAILLFKFCFIKYYIVQNNRFNVAVFSYTFEVQLFWQFEMFLCSSCRWISKFARKLNCPLRMCHWEQFFQPVICVHFGSLLLWRSAVLQNKIKHLLCYKKKTKEVKM